MQHELLLLDDGCLLRHELLQHGGLVLVLVLGLVGDGPVLFWRSGTAAHLKARCEQQHSQPVHSVPVLQQLCCCCTIYTSKYCNKELYLVISIFSWGFDEFEQRSSRQVETNRRR